MTSVLTAAVSRHDPRAGDRSDAMVSGTTPASPAATRLRVVICGSFRRDPEGLRRRYAELQSRFEIVSPVSLDFVDPHVAFVRLPHELDESEAAIEQRHLDSLTAADFIWLHAPEGHLGVSAAVELGHAHSLGIPIFGDTMPSERAFQDWVRLVNGPNDIELAQDAKAPGESLRSLQSYYERTARRRGWAGESAQDTLLLMTEEMGELARAVRRATGIARDGDWDGQSVAEELADMQLYLVHLANALGIELAEAVTAKEAVNAVRAARRIDVA